MSLTFVIYCHVISRNEGLPKKVRRYVVHPKSLQEKSLKVVIFDVRLINIIYYFFYFHFYSSIS